MNVLIIEDDENKRMQLVTFMKDTFCTTEPSVRKSRQGGLKAIIDGGYDLVLLDMTMPTYDIGADEDGGQPQAYAGRDILRQMSRRNIVTPVIVVTQFDEFGEGENTLTLEEVKTHLKQAHPHSYLGAVYYNVAEEGWKDALTDLILNMQEQEERISDAENSNR